MNSLQPFVLLLLIVNISMAFPLAKIAENHAPTAEAAQDETTSAVSLDKVNQMTPTQTVSLEIARQMKHTENERKKRQFGFMPGLGGGASMANTASWSFGVPGMPFGASFSMSNSMSGFGK